MKDVRAWDCFNFLAGLNALPKHLEEAQVALNGQTRYLWLEYHYQPKGSDIRHEESRYFRLRDGAAYEQGGERVSDWNDIAQFIQRDQPGLWGKPGMIGSDDSCYTIAICMSDNDGWPTPKGLDDSSDVGTEVVQGEAIQRACTGTNVGLEVVTPRSSGSRRRRGGFGMPSTSRPPSTFTAEGWIRTHTKAGRDIFLRSLLNQVTLGKHKRIGDAMSLLPIDWEADPPLRFKSRKPACVHPVPRQASPYFSRQHRKSSRLRALSGRALRRLDRRGPEFR